MSISPPILMVRHTESCVFIKINGRATCQNSVDFKSLLVGFMHRGFKQFVMDLTECLIMDSTFLGVMAGAGVKINRESSNGSTQHIQLLNPNPRVSGLIDNLGVLSVFDVVNAPVNHSNAYVAVIPPEGQSPSPREFCKTSLEAHEILMKLDKANVSKFKDVTTMLKQKMDSSDT